MEFFNEGEIDETPGSLAATFITFGKFLKGLSIFHLIGCRYILTNCYSKFSVLNIAFTLSILGFLIMHITLVGANTSTIEVIIYVSLCCQVISKRLVFTCFIFQAYEKKTSPKWCYDLGWKKNFEQVNSFFFHPERFTFDFYTFSYFCMFHPISGRLFKYLSIT